MNILFIDDDVKRNLPLVRNLEYGQGWKVNQQRSPKSALQALRGEAKFDFILLDVMMPPDEIVDRERSNLGQSTGLLLMEKIYEITQGKIPIVILSARQDLQEILTRDKRVKAYLKKTMSEKEIIATIKEALPAKS